MDSHLDAAEQMVDQIEPALQAMLAEDPVDQTDEVAAGRPESPAAAMEADSKPRATAPNHVAALANQLQQLGYSKKQADAIQAGRRSEVLEHHGALSNLGLTFQDVTDITKRAPSLQIFAEKYQQLRKSLPTLSRSGIVNLAKEPAGIRALETLLDVANDLKTKPPHLNDQQLASVAKMGERLSLLALHSLGQELGGHPYNLTHNQLVAIAGNNGGGHALEAIKQQLPALVQAPYNLTPEQVVIASNQGGKGALEAVIAYLPKLLGASHNLSREEVVTLARRQGGRQNLERLIRSAAVR